MTRHLFLLSPYRPPTSYPVSLDANEAAAWLNGWAALWHPLALKDAALPPAPASSYEHNDPSPGAVYVLPGGPSLLLADDWRGRAAEAGAVLIDATAERATTLAALIDALPGPVISESIVRLFMAIGFGHLMLDTLFDAAGHERLLDAAGFWQDVQTAARSAIEGNVAAVRTSLQAAAEKLRAAREGLSPNGVALVDLIVRTDDTIAEPWPCVFSTARPVTLVSTSSTLAKMATDAPARFGELKAAIPADLPACVELAVGVATERDDALLPVESQLWSLRQARLQVQALLGVKPTLYGRLRAEYHPQLPSWLSQAGYQGFLALNLNGATMPSHGSSIVQWPGPDGRSINAFTGTPLPAYEQATFFNLAHYLHDAGSRESSPVLALIHTQTPAESYRDLVTLSELALVFGEWQGLERVLSDTHNASYVRVPEADEFAMDSLDDRITRRKLPDPVSGLAKHARLRRRFEGALTLAALHRSLTPTSDDAALLAETESMEQAVELFESPAVDALESAWAAKLADRLLARSEPNRTGWLVLNPGGAARRMGLEMKTSAPVPVDGPVKASDFRDGTATVVVEVPGLGFAWIPKGVPGTTFAKPRLKTAEGLIVRNEFLEAEFDGATGGVKAIRDARANTTRLGQILCWNPGSRMIADSVRVTRADGVLGEIASDGNILGEDDRVLARFHQRVRAWLGRPALEFRIDLQPVEPPTGYCWQNYFGCRFAWRDERAARFRGVNGMNAMTHAPRPNSPDYFELRHGKERSFIFTGGLPFLQLNGRRMADVVLVPPGETATSFELLVALDREYPMATAQSWFAPPIVLPVEKGPPPTGPSGWLAQFDLPSLVLTGLRPSAGHRGVTARFLETAGFAGSSELQFAKPPVRAVLTDLNGETTMPITIQNGNAPVDFSANELVTLTLDWS